LPTLPLVLEMTRSSRHRVWAIVYLALVGLAENSIGFEQSGGIVAGHLATFVLFILLLAMLTNLTKSYLVRSTPVELAEREIRSSSAARSYSQEG
jgi:hypothetical protein